MRNLKIFTKNIEQEAIDQIDTLLNQPAFAECKVRIMPDVHAGAGCVIGFTANLGEKVIPNITGVDLGCSILVCPLGNIDINFEKLDNVIRENVPYGLNVGNVSFHETNELIKDLFCLEHLKNIDRLKKSVGSLGGGNHFIEIDKDENDNKYLVIHSGSRNLGKQVADYYQNLAIRVCHSNKTKCEEVIAKLKAEGRQTEIQEELRKIKANEPDIPNDLCYLEGKDREDYLHDMKICQVFAIKNRMKIAERIAKGMEWGNEWKEKCWESVHNYIDQDNMIRKGAISAKKGEMVIIPMNMRDGCIIGIGKGNEDWNFSAPHGAGRIMSRAKARAMVDLQEFKESMEGIYSTSVKEETVDEAPMVYKPMQEIIDNIVDTVEVKFIIKPVYNFKADN